MRGELSVVAVIAVVGVAAADRATRRLVVEIYEPGEGSVSPLDTDTRPHLDQNSTLSWEHSLRATTTFWRRTDRLPCLQVMQAS